ncbi:hypothetical protein HHX47_DHR2000310 [Lentinula edodes]|nr:hypothetical protein HHX47_DHR2000310 [Lentinula edodes]
MSTEHSGRVFPTPFAGRRDLTHVIPRDSVELQHSSSLNSPSFTWIQQDPPIIRQKLHRRTHSTGVRSDNRTPSKRKPLSSLSSPEICTPSHTPVFLLPHPERPTVLRRTSSYYSITPSVHRVSIQSSAPALCSWDMRPDSGDDGDDDNMIQAPWLRHKHTAKKGSPGFKEKLFSFATGSNTRSRERLISTKPGERGAGETETEIDEPVRFAITV